MQREANRRKGQSPKRAGTTRLTIGRDHNVRVRQNCKTSIRRFDSARRLWSPNPTLLPRLRQKRQNHLAHGLVCCAVATPASDGERVALPGTLLAGGRRSPGPPRGMGESGTHSDECPLARMRLDRRL
jgi:hypothetical protein